MRSINNVKLIISACQEPQRLGKIPYIFECMTVTCLSNQCTLKCQINEVDLNRPGGWKKFRNLISGGQNKREVEFEKRL